MAAATLRMPLRTSLEKLPTVGGIVRDYGFRLYFRAQRLSWWQRLRCAVMMFLVEYLVYRADAVVERAKDIDLDPARNSDLETVRQYRATVEAHKARLEALLRRTHAYNEVVARQIDLGEEYIYLENKVTSSGAASLAELRRLSELRPSDVRLLHGMTFALLDRPVDNDLLDLFWPVEVLADMCDDLKTYHQDIAAGHFNTYGAFVRLYGQAAPGRLRAEIAHYERLFHAELLKFPLARRAELARLGTRRYCACTEAFPEPQLQHRSRPPQLEGTS